MIDQTSNTVLEVSRIQELARHYRRQGFDVLVRPSQDLLPTFLKGLAPDLVAKKENEGIVVEVKSKATLKESVGLSELARRVGSVPGWRFDLVVVNPRWPGSPQGDTPIERSQIDKRLESGRKLSDSDPGAAVVVIWSAIEALLRRVAMLSNVKLPTAAPSTILRDLRLEGILGDQEYEELRQAAEIRNAEAHGMFSSLNSDVVLRLIHRAEALQRMEVTMSSRLTKHDLTSVVEEAITSLGGSASLVDVARYIWEHYEDRLRQSDDLFYTWQYDIRWAANQLRRSGKMNEVEKSPRGIWELLPAEMQEIKKQ
jgi:uncharacterized protein YutE (UPF0331/DUF86 family)